MADRADKDKNPGRSGVTLVELLFVLVILGILFGSVSVVATDSLRLAANPYSSEKIRREAKAAANWLSNVIYRATLGRKDFELRVSSGGPVKKSHMTVLWKATGEVEEWGSDRIGLKVKPGNSAAVHRFNYNWRAQTLTPAVTIFVYQQNGDKIFPTQWSIIISGDGLVRMSERTS